MNSLRGRWLDSEQVDQPEFKLEQPPIVVSAQQARQGVTGSNVRFVLAFGTVGAIVALAVIWFVFV
jgi:hypothetical protein